VPDDEVGADACDVEVVEECDAAEEEEDAAEREEGSKREPPADPPLELSAERGAGGGVMV
jgi:hypothetical protein